MKLPPDWREFIDLLSCHEVRFLIVGAHALAANGRPRATQDLDIFVEPSEDNAAKLGAALAEFGFGSLARESHRFAQPDRMATLGVPPLRIDIMTSISGVGFARAWDGRIRATLAGHEVGFLGREELLVNKRASGRPKDLADIALLAEIEET
ncbi:hypothetical protein [Haliangium sp.]|uniref:hypothetical protein n=1 Tax=Haliangium sp. TaxID=2663208 RepID=UPI003D106C9D